MSDNLRLAEIATAFETLAGGSTSGNASEAGYWKRIADALETEIGSTSTANATFPGYLLRAAVALEGHAGTSGAEENANEAGYLKRIVDALETDTGVTTGSLIKRLHAAATVWTGAVPATTWNPADKSSQIVLSNGDLTATNNGATYTFHSVRATQSRTSGVRTYVVTAGARSGGPIGLVGFANGTQVLAAAIGETVNGVSYTNTSGNVRHNGVTLATLATWITGDVITAEIDIDASTVRFKKNAGAFSAALSVAGIGTTIFPAVTIADPFLHTADFTGW